MSHEPTPSDPTPEPPPTPAAVHRSVLLEEVVSWLTPDDRVASGDSLVLVDGTVGAGGHARALAGRVGPGGHVVGLDRDTAMLALAEPAVKGLPVTLFNASYDDARGVLDELRIGAVDGVVLDLGLSSDQLAWTERGFSFANDGPLDMRFDPESDDPSAADLVNTLDEAELARIFYEYGEERYSRRVAWRIVEARKLGKITTTSKLAELVRKSIPGKWGPMDPSTRTFQALRIAVNDELGRLERALKELPDLLKPGGRLAIISFHSLEDRRVKHAFRDDPRLNVLTRKPITATPGELAANPRSRSAKLRVAERCPNPPGLTETPTPTSKTWKRRKG